MAVLTAGTSHRAKGDKAQANPVWRSAMPNPALPNGGFRTWTGGTTVPPVAHGAPPPGGHEMLHLLQRTTFGLTESEVVQTQSMPMDQWIDQQLNPGAIDDSACDAIIGSLGHETNNLSLNQLWNYRNLSYPQAYYPWWETREETMIRQVHSRRQLFEVMCDFWHNHFNMRAGNYPIRHIWRSFDRDVVRNHALGNFRVFLEQVGGHTAMLYYLDNQASSDGGPNENYARELFELHTLGAEHYLVPGGYVDDDVFEAARCYTGWSVNNSSSTGNTGEFLYKEGNHDRFQKVVLGHSIPRDQPPMTDGRQVFDILAAHPMTHRHIARQLCLRFVGDNPPQSMIDDLAAVFGANWLHPEQIKITLRALFLHPEFINSWHGKIRRPNDYLAAVIRAMGGSFRWESDWEWRTRPLGHILFDWPTPDGFPDDTASWITTNGMLYRWNIVNDIAVGSNQSVSVNLVAQTPGWAVTPQQLVDFWIVRLLHRGIDAHITQALLDFVAEGRNPNLALPTETRNVKIPSLVALICSSPEFQHR